jgi:hypothetical protein
MARFSERISYLPTYGGAIGALVGIATGALIGILRQNPGAALFLAAIGFFVGSFGGYLLGYAGFMAVSLHRQGKTLAAIMFMTIVVAVAFLVVWGLFL